jgi:hypothetical protein
MVPSPLLMCCLKIKNIGLLVINPGRIKMVLEETGGNQVFSFLAA